MPEVIRAKFTVSEITSYMWAGSGKTVKLMPLYDESIPEDRRFAEATPSGHIEMLVNNPAALDVLQLGRVFYVDFTPVVGDGQK